MIGKLELDRLISAQRCRERDLVVAMIVQRLIDPCSGNWRNHARVAHLLPRWPKNWERLAEATEKVIYCTQPWTGFCSARSASRRSSLLVICARAELVLYDVSSSFYEGTAPAPLAQFGQ